MCVQCSELGLTGIKHYILEYRRYGLGEKKTQGTISQIPHNLQLKNLKKKKKNSLESLLIFSLQNLIFRMFSYKLKKVYENKYIYDKYGFL